MKKSICLAVSFLFMSALAMTAQKRIVMESSADEFVTLWDNTTAKYSNYETKDEEDKGRKFANTSSADLYIFKAPKEKATGYGVVILPGGSDRTVGCSTMLAEWLRDNGVTAAVMKYRLPNYGHSEAAFEDGAGAIKYCRDNADRLNLDRSKIGICGSSAGGHLAAWGAAAARGDQRPDFAILIYGAMIRCVFWAGSVATRR